jgi:hypothetical protein
VNGERAAIVNSMDEALAILDARKAKGREAFVA